MKLLDRLADKLGYTPKTATRTFTCAYCGKRFEWTGNITSSIPQYCSASHRKSAREVRNKRRKSYEFSTRKKEKVYDHGPDLSKVGRCPTPYKVVHRDMYTAEQTIAKVDPSMHAYRCPCGGIHIGHRKRKNENPRK